MLSTVELTSPRTLPLTALIDCRARFSCSLANPSTRDQSATWSRSYSTSVGASTGAEAFFAVLAEG